MMTYVAELIDGIRTYGPGKFNLVVDSYIYDLSLDGFDEEIGSCAEYGEFYGIMRGPIEASAELNDAERNLLDNTAGIILFENDQGFVDVQYYETDLELETDWDDLCKYFDEMGGRMLKGETLKSGAPKTCETCGVTVELQVCESAAGFYLGTWCDCGPYTRETGYHKTREQAELAKDWRA